jgi:thiol-disulfide isomerase/thioredoxin
VALVAALVVAVVAGLAWRATNGKMRRVPVAAGTAAAGPAAGTTAHGAQGREIMTRGTVSPDTMSQDTATPARPAGRVTAAELGRPLGERATLLQFSSAFCAPCRATRVILADVASQAHGVAHVEIDAESHLDLVRALGVLRTPTVFVLGSDGAITARASGQPRKADVLGALEAVRPAGTPYSPGLETG